MQQMGEHFEAVHDPRPATENEITVHDEDAASANGRESVPVGKNG